LNRLWYYRVDPKIILTPFSPHLRVGHDGGLVAPILGNVPLLLSSGVDGHLDAPFMHVNPALRWSRFRIKMRAPLML
jgi:hypothetical protein